MLPNSPIYRRRLLRLNTLEADGALDNPAKQRQLRNSAVVRMQCRGGRVTTHSLTESKDQSSGGRARRVGRSSKYDSSELWMQQPVRHRQTQKTDLETNTFFDAQSSPLDEQTNNSRRKSGSAAGKRGGVTTAVNNANSERSPPMKPEVEDFGELELDVHCIEEDSSTEFEPEVQYSNISSHDEFSNENAVAKGANALVKQSTSRQTEIIDTSKLLEEGKVETQYEVPQDDPEYIEETDHKLIDEYEKTFAYARRLRGLLRMKFKVTDRNSIETNFHLVKAHEHPTQKVIGKWRNVDLGDPYDNQIRKQKLVDDYRAICGQKKVPKNGEVRAPVYPSWIRFYIRFKKDRSDKRWEDFCAFKTKMKKLTGGKVSAPKNNDKYLPIFYDVWTTSIAAFAKPETTVLELVDPVFSKLGLESRADFKLTIGCFVGDKRGGKARVQGAPVAAEELTMQMLCSDLYKRNCTEIFVNDNRIEMFKDFPAFYYSANGQPTVGNADGDGKKKDKSTKSTKKDQKDKKDKKSGKNQSNVDTDTQQTLLSGQKPPVKKQQFGSRGFTSADLADSQYGDTTLPGKLFIADDAKIAQQAADLAASSPSVTNQNMSVHDCDSNDVACNSNQTAEGGNTVTTFGRSETTKRESE